MQFDSESQEYMGKKLKLFQHRETGEVVIGIPHVNKAEIQDLYLVDKDLETVSSVGDFADMELYGNGRVKKVTDQVDRNKLIELNWPRWENQ